MLVHLQRVLALVALVSISPSAMADGLSDRFSAAGYLRMAARPDFAGGVARLGFWNLYGRLLNETPWGALELRLELLPQRLDSDEVWALVQARIEGGSFANADAGNGVLDNFRVTQAFIQAGNIGTSDIVWQVGTLHYFYGDLGLYDFRPAVLFNQTLGVSATYQRDWFSAVAGLGDAGFGIRGTDYSAILSGGAGVRLSFPHVEIGGGGEFFFEPKVSGSRNAPLATPNVDYEDFVRGRVVERFDIDNPGTLPLFSRPQAKGAKSFSAVGYVGFGNLGPLVWNNLFINFRRHHPDNFIQETFQDNTYDIFVSDLTDERTSLVIGSEAQFVVWPERLDAVLGLLYGLDKNSDNKIAAGEDNRWYGSAVLRLQAYLTQTVHLLLENSIAREKSTNGNLWRGHYDSVFASSAGQPDSAGLEFGDTDSRDTFQLKGGVVLNPPGYGIFSRPSLRILYGFQWSNTHAAFSSNFSGTLSDFDAFSETRDRRTHQVFAIEAETWF